MLMLMITASRRYCSGAMPLASLLKCCADIQSTKSRSLSDNLYAGCQTSLRLAEFSCTQFDIVKVRLQSSDAYSGALDCARSIVKNEGPLAFYKGSSTTASVNRNPL